MATPHRLRKGHQLLLVEYRPMDLPVCAEKADTLLEGSTSVYAVLGVLVCQPGFTQAHSQK